MGKNQTAAGQNKRPFHLRGPDQLKGQGNRGQEGPAQGGLAVQEFLEVIGLNRGIIGEAKNQGVA